DHPVTLPLYDEPIKSGMAPESGGSFSVFNFADYFDPKLLQAFGEKYGVKVEVTTYDSYDQATARLASRAVAPDVICMVQHRTSQVVAGRLIKPLNHSYIPNLSRNVWPAMQNPFYDVGSRYTVPYTLALTGIGWRSEKVSEDIGAMENPWDIFWKAEKYKGYV